MASSPFPWLLGAVGIGAVAIAASKTRGSRAILSAKDHAVLLRMLTAAPKAARPRGSRATLLELQAMSRATTQQAKRPAAQQPKAAPQQQQAIAQAVAPQKQGQLVGTTRVKVNEGAMWKLAAEKMYGAYVDLPVVATREALQNSWDAIEEAVTAGMLERTGDGQFDVTWDAATRTLAWEDNGIGMSEQTADQKFLSLGDTSKIATMSSREMQRGGFGIAKAILLGASETFTWTLHTRNRIFTSHGFSSEIAIHSGRPRQGTKLTIVGIEKRHVGAYSYWSGEHFSILERLVTFLQSCDAPFPIRFNGVLVEPSFMGPGVTIAENARWGEGITGRVRSYARSDVGGCMYLRLGGLTQFWKKIGDGKAPIDVVVDLDTAIRPTAQGYPLTASRMDLSGPAEVTWNALYAELTVDLLSTTQGPKPEFVEEAPSHEVLDLNQRQLQSLSDLADKDPTLQAMMEAIPGLRVALGRARQSAYDDQPPPPAAQQRSTSTAGAIARSFREMAQEAAAESPPEPDGEEAKQEQVARELRQAATEKERLRAAELRGRGFVNPFAGIGALRINRGQWTVERLNPYLQNPGAILPILFLWRAAVSLVLAETRAKRDTFSVGFIFDDGTRAEYSQGLFSLNPVPVVKLYQELPSNPEIIAAYLHNKACHEATHRLGYGGHDESYVIARESLADKTAGALAPLTRMVALALGMTDQKAKPTGPGKTAAVKGPPRVARVPLWDGRVEHASMPVFLAGVASLLTHAGYPTHVVSNDGFYSDKLDAYGINERVEDEEGITIHISKVSYDPTSVSFDGKRWTTFNPGRFSFRDLLTATEKKVDNQRSTQVLDLAQRAAKKLAQEFRKGEVRPFTTMELAGRAEGYAGSRSLAPVTTWTRGARRRAVAQAEAILDRRR